MITVRMRVRRRLGWRPDDKVQLVIGSENAATLAASTPAGGTVALEVSPFPNGVGALGLGTGRLGDLLGHGGEQALGAPGAELGDGPLGHADWARLLLEHRMSVADKCCVLPVGVKIRDVAGNVSDVVEELEQVRDYPRAPSALRVAAIMDGEDPPAALPGVARLSWTASADV